MASSTSATTDLMHRVIFLCVFLSALHLSVEHPQEDGGQETMGTQQADSVGGPRLAEPPLRVGAFNVQVFGRTKMKKTDVAGTLIKILRRYDVVLLQEIRDSKDTALDLLIARINEVDKTNPFQVVHSERLGRTHSKEQYAFLYRTNRLTVKDIYQFDDGKDDGNDAFEREPYAVRFTSPSTVIEDFAMIAIHTSPEKAVEELKALALVHEKTRKHWRLEDIIIAGDFNADGDYVKGSDWSGIALRSDRRFNWLIKDTADTTVGSTDAAYDRFVVTGTKLLDAIVPDSAKTFKFDEEFKLTQEEAEDVSDHYPIELEIAGKVHEKLQRHLQTEAAVNINQLEEVTSINFCRAIAKSKVKGFEVEVLKKESALFQVTVVRRGTNDVIKTLQEFQKAYPEVLRNETVAVAEAYIRSPGFADPPYIYGLTRVKDVKCDVIVTCRLQAPLTVRVSINKRYS